MRTGADIQVDSVLVINAAPGPVFRALSDYDRYAELSRRYTQSRFVAAAADGTPRIYTEVTGCVWFFCRSVRRYARLELLPDKKIVATVEAEHSDLISGREQWLLEAIPGGTRVTYTHRFDPDFWVPPLIGVWAMRRVLEQDAQTAAQRLEQMALGELVGEDIDGDIDKDMDESTDKDIGTDVSTQMNNEATESPAKEQAAQ